MIAESGVCHPYRCAERRSRCFNVCLHAVSKQGGKRVMWDTALFCGWVVM
jgi:hypothetical protein